MESLFDIWQVKKATLPFLVREPNTGIQIVVRSYDWINKVFRGYIVSYYTPEQELKIGANHKGWRFETSLSEYANAKRA